MSYEILLYINPFAIMPSRLIDTFSNYEMSLFILLILPDLKSTMTITTIAILAFFMMTGFVE